MDSEMIERYVANVDGRIEGINHNMDQYNFKRLLKALRSGELPNDIGEDDKMVEFYKKGIEGLKVEKLIYLTFKTGNAGLFDRLYKRYNENAIDLLELSSELVSTGDINEGKHLEFSNEMVKQMNYVKVLCRAGTNGCRVSIN